MYRIGLLHQDCPIFLCDLVRFGNIDSNKDRRRSATLRAATTRLADRVFSPPDIYRGSVSHCWFGSQIYAQNYV